LFLIGKGFGLFVFFTEDEIRAITPRRRGE